MNTKLLTSFCVLLTLSFNNFASAGIITWGGDAIGSGSTWTDGHGAVDSTQSGDLLNWNWNVNVGAPAFEFNSDGKAQFDKLRAVTTIARNLTDSPLDWSRHNWTVDVWEKSSYLAKGAPIVTANLGATPSNWSGYQTLANGDRVPDIAPFGVPGGNAPDGTVSYEMVFDLSGVSSFQTPLPEGDYIVSFTSRTAINTHGGSGVLSSRIGQGPVPFYSATSPFRFEPGPVIGRITSNEDFRFALNLSIQSDLMNGDFLSGMDNWVTGGAGTVETIEIDGNSLAMFTAGSPAILSQSIITDPEPFLLSFDYQFGQPGGSFDFFLGDDLLGSLDSTSIFSPEWNTFSMRFEDELLWGRQDELRFVYDGPTGSNFYLDNVSVNGVSAVPEPSSLALFAIGTASIALMRRRRRNQLST